MTGQAQTNFVKGAAILTTAGFISRFLGLFYRIVITRLIGAEGVGLYQMAYPIYITLLVVSVSGIPVALARLVSENIALGRWRDALRIFRVARGLSLIFGAVISCLLFFFAKPLITFLGLDPRSYYTVVAISPSILVVSVMASYRGFFQGMQNMIPTAYSQIVEQVVRMITMIGLAYLLLPYGIEISAAGATFSAFTGSLAGLLLLLVVFFQQRQTISLKIVDDRVSSEKIFQVVKRIVSYVIPVTIGALVLPLMSLVDLIFVPQRLQTIGFTAQQATILYGELTGVALVLVHFPEIITSSLQISLIPSISTAYTLKLTDVIKKRTSLALRYAVLIGLPSAAGLFILAEPLCKVIFDVPTAATSLQFVAWGVFFIALQQISSGILLGIGQVKLPARNLLIGASVNAVINYTLTAIPMFGIRGAALGTVLGFATAASLNLISLWKRVHFQVVLSDFLVKPIIASGVMMAGAYLGYHGVLRLAELALPFGTDLISLVFAVCFGASIFFIVMILIGGLTENDLCVLPGMQRLIRPLKRLKLLRSEEN